LCGLEWVCVCSVLFDVDNRQLLIRVGHLLGGVVQRSSVVDDLEAILLRLFAVLIEATLEVGLGSLSVDDVFGFFFCDFCDVLGDVRVLKY
jgi:hypothetical protein